MRRVLTPLYRDRRGYRSAHVTTILLTHPTHRELHPSSPSVQPPSTRDLSLRPSKRRQTAPRRPLIAKRPKLQFQHHVFARRLPQDLLLRTPRRPAPDHSFHALLPESCHHGGVHGKGSKSVVQGVVEVCGAVGGARCGWAGGMCAASAVSGFG